MKRQEAPVITHGHLTIGYLKVSEVVATLFFTALIFGFYLAHYSWSTGFFTPAFTPLLATLFFGSVLFTVVNTAAKVLNPRKDLLALVELVGAVLFVAVAAWIFSTFPLDFAHVTDVVPVEWRFLFSWITNDIGRIIVTLALVGGIIALIVDAVKLVWRVTVRRFESFSKSPM